MRVGWLIDLFHFLLIGIRQNTEDGSAANFVQISFSKGGSKRKIDTRIKFLIYSNTLYSSMKINMMLDD